MSNFYKDKLKNIIEILVMLVGIGCFITQAYQYFIGKWFLPFYKEVFMLVLFYIFSRYNSKVVELFDAIVYRVRNFKINSKVTNTVEEAKAGIIGEGTDETHM